MNGAVTDGDRFVFNTCGCTTRSASRDKLGAFLSRWSPYRFICGCLWHTRPLRGVPWPLHTDCRASGSKSGTQSWVMCSGFFSFFFFLPWLLSHKEEKLKKMQVGVFVALTTEPPLNTNNSHPKLKIQNPSTQYILLRESRQNHLKIICDTLNSHWLNYIFLRHRTFSLSDCLISH